MNEYLDYHKIDDPVYQRIHEQTNIMIRNPLYDQLLSSFPHSAMDEVRARILLHVHNQIKNQLTNDLVNKT